MSLGEFCVQIVIVVRTVVMDVSPGSCAQQHVVGGLLQTVHKVTSDCLFTFTSYMDVGSQ